MINYISKISYFLKSNGIIENNSNIINHIKAINNIDSIKYKIKDILQKSFSKSIIIFYLISLF